MADSELENDFGTRLRTARESQNRSQEEVAWKAGVDQSDLSKYERGKIRPGPQVVKRLAKSLGIDPNVLYGPGDNA